MLTTFFPQTTFKNQAIVDITKHVKLSHIIGDQIFSMQEFNIKNDDRPEHVAFNVYDDANLAWLVLLPNVYLDPYYEWPLSTRDFETWLKKKYGSLETAQSTILFYEHKTKDITISADTFNHNATLTYVSGGDYSQVDAYTYHDRINNNKRHIKLIDGSFTSLIITQLKELFPDVSDI